MGVSEMTDIERQLTAIIFRLYLSRFGDSVNPYPWGSENYGPTQFHIDSWNKPVPGDLVIETTSIWPQRTQIGWYVKFDEDGDGRHLIRALDGNEEAWWHNCKFSIIRNMDPELLYYGDQRKFVKKVHKAFKRGDEKMYSYAGAQFIDDKVIITIRPHVWMVSAGSFLEERMTIKMKWDKKTTIKSILSALVDGGYGVEWDKRIKRKKRGVLT